MKETDRRQLENQLMVMGLSRLEDRELVPQMARIINTYGGHDFFEGLLGECEASKRTEMYEALRPHLTFNPLPLETYISNIKARASAIASRGEPICIGDDKYVESAKEDATGVVATLTCCKCTKQQEFYGATAVEAATRARDAGWVRDLVRQKEICPKCPAVWPAMHRTN